MATRRQQKEFQANEMRGNFVSPAPRLSEHSAKVPLNDKS
jgi:hypothetical protein